MELRQLQYFHVLAHELHFTRAAKGIPLSQPQLSLQIKRLETELGVALFDRSNREVRLTEAGQVFLEHSVKAVGDLADAARLAAAVARGETGVMRVAYVAPVSFDLLPEHLRVFCKDAPNVTVQTEEAMSGEVAAGLLSGRFDIGYLPLAAIRGLEFQFVECHEVAAVLAAGHPLAALEEVPLSALHDELFITSPVERSPGWVAQVHDWFRQANIAPAVGSISNSPSTMLALVASGLGVGLLPMACHRMAGPEIAFRRLADVDAVVRLGIAWREGATRQPLIRKYVEQVAAQVRRRDRDRQRATGAGLSQWR